MSQHRDLVERLAVFAQTSLKHAFRATACRGEVPDRGVAPQLRQFFSASVALPELIPDDGLTGVVDDLLYRRAFLREFSLLGSR